MLAAGLSYIGLGAQPPTPEWGAMLSGARQYLSGCLVDRGLSGTGHHRGHPWREPAG
jgi:hypothetical protein